MRRKRKEKKVEKEGEQAKNLVENQDEIKIENEENDEKERSKYLMI